jgi:hypothetical protein
MDELEVALPANLNPCQICGNSAAKHIPSDWLPGWDCPRCGEYDYDKSLGWRRIRSPDQMVHLSGWVREQNANGSKPVRIRPEIAARVMQRKPPGLQERASRILVVLARDYRRPYLWFVPDTITHNPELQGVSYSSGNEDVMMLLNVLEDQGFLKFAASQASLLVKGILAAEALRGPGSTSPQGFVAMWFDDNMSDAWLNGFEPGIRNAGYRPRRIDTKDYVGGVSDEIMAEIRGSRFVVADYTGQRNGVYFEAGFAMGLGLTILPTCRANDIDNLHFDIKHLNTLLWKTPEQLADTLAKRIRAIIGAGPDAID